MPQCPTEAQAEASRLNGALSSGPQDTSRTRFNALRHGFTAALRPPTDPDEARFFDQLLADLAAHKEPKGRPETLLLEEIAGLELRRVKIQQTLLDAPADPDEPALAKIMLMDRYESQVLRKLDRGWERFDSIRNARLCQEEWEEEGRQEPGYTLFPQGHEYEEALALVEDPEASRQLGEHLGPEALEVMRRLTGQLREADDLSKLVSDYFIRLWPLMVCYFEERGWQHPQVVRWFEIQNERAMSGSFGRIEEELSSLLAWLPEGPAFVPPRIPEAEPRPSGPAEEPAVTA